MISKKNIQNNLKFLPIFLILISVGCVPYKSIINYSETEELPEGPQPIENYIPVKIQPNDVVSISVISEEKETSALLNRSQNGYMVDHEGNIDYPLVGKIQLKDLTINEAKELIHSSIDKYFVKVPVVNLNLINFKIFVHGEVGSPGAIQTSTERLSLLDAIILAGDFTSYSSRDDIMIIREVGEERTFVTVDFNNLDIMKSPHFYLKQNDVIYVKPLRRKTSTVSAASNQTLRYAQFAFSVFLFVTTILNLR